MFDRFNQLFLVGNMHESGCIKTHVLLLKYVGRRIVHDAANGNRYLVWMGGQCDQGSEKRTESVARHK